MEASSSTSSFAKILHPRRTASAIASDGHRHLVEDVLQQVVRHRPRRDQTLLSDRDRLSLGLTDPDRKEALAFGFPQQDDGRVRRELDPDAGHGHLDHGTQPTVHRPPWTGNLVLHRRAFARRYPSEGTGSMRGRNESSTSGSARRASMSCTARMSGTFRNRSSKSSPYPTTNSSGQSNPR